MPICLKTWTSQFFLECYFGIQYNKISKLLPKKSLPKFHLPFFLFKISTRTLSPPLKLPNLAGSDVSIFLAIFHQSLQSCYFQVTEVWWHCHLVWQQIVVFFGIPGGCFGGWCLMKFEGKFLELFWRCLYVEGWVNMSWDKQKRIACVYVCTYNCLVFITTIFRFMISLGYLLVNKCWYETDMLCLSFMVLFKASSAIFAFISGDYNKSPKPITSICDNFLMA